MVRKVFVRHLPAGTFKGARLRFWAAGIHPRFTPREHSLTVKRQAEQIATSLAEEQGWQLEGTVKVAIASTSTNGCTFEFTFQQAEDPVVEEESEE